MYWLPNTAWWRFVGWLILGLSIYTFYGYNHSTLGRRSGRASRTPTPVKIAATGFLAIAVGLFTIPHNANFARLFVMTMTETETDHGRALTGFAFIAAGLILGFLGWLAASVQARRTS
jgi:amino acid transporter